MLSAVNTWWHVINDFSPRCYGKALKIFPESSSLWHDLGVNYFHQSQAVLQEDKFPLADKSVQALKKAISLEPTNHKHWTALGHVACHKGIVLLDIYRKRAKLFNSWVKVCRINPEFRILRLNFHRKSASKC